MDLQALGDTARGLIAAHPVLYTLLVLPIFLWAVRKFEAAIPKIADYIDDYQEKALKRAGLSDEELAILEEHEAKDMRAAADELDKRATARRAAQKAPTPAPASGGAPGQPA